MSFVHRARLALSLVLGLAVGLSIWLVPTSVPAAPAERPRAETITLSVMSLNIFYGGDDYDLKTGDFCAVADGCPEALRKIAGIIRKSGADVVGLQEAERNTARLAAMLGWHADPRAQVISRFPLLRPTGGAGLYTLVEPVPGQVVAVANTHLPSSPYGPYWVQRGVSKKRVLALEDRLRTAALDHVVRLLPKLAARGIPVFLTGDFNSPSHLDWTQAVADARTDVPYPVEWPASARLAAAGFVDSYRAVHPDPVADPGFTWTPGGPQARDDEVPDRIDWVLAAGPATTVSSLLVGERRNPQVDLATAGRFPSDHRGVVSTFDVAPSTAPLWVSPASRRVVVGEALPVRFHASGRSREVVGIVARGASGRLLTPASTRGRTSGNVTLSTSRLRPGHYDVVLRDAATGRTRARSPIWVYRQGADPRMRTDARTYRPGEDVTVSWQGAPGQHLDWVGLFRCRRTCDSPGSYLAYRYTRTRIEGALVLSDVVEPGEGAPPWPLPPGQYVARLLVDDSYVVVAETPRFTVVPH